MLALLFPFGSHGDVRPFVILGSALKARGHEVVLVANPRFARMAEAAHLQLESQGTVAEYAAVLDSADLWHPRRGPRLLHDYVFGPTIARQLETVKRYARAETVVIAGTFAVGAWLGAERHGLSCVRLVGQPAALFGAHDPPVLPSGRKMGGPLWLRKTILGLLEMTVFKPVGRDLNRIRGELGLPVWRDHVMTSYVAADLGLCLFPEWFAPATPDWPETARHVGFFAEEEEQGSSLDSGLVEFLDGGSPPVVFTPGPAGYQHSEAFFRCAAAACAELNVRAVFVTRGQKLETDWPQFIWACDYAPFDSLFPKASLVVHHGGIGTVACGLAAGRPQLITPFGFDQPDNAWRLEQLGVGITLVAQSLTGSALAEKMGVALASPGMVERARLFQTKMAAEAGASVDTACRLIEEARHRTA